MNPNESTGQQQRGENEESSLVPLPEGLYKYGEPYATGVYPVFGAHQQLLWYSVPGMYNVTTKIMGEQAEEIKRLKEIILNWESVHESLAVDNQRKTEALARSAWKEIAVDGLPESDSEKLFLFVEYRDRVFQLNMKWLVRPCVMGKDFEFYAKDYTHYIELPPIDLPTP